MGKTFRLTQQNRNTDIFFVDENRFTWTMRASIWAILAFLLLADSCCQAKTLRKHGGFKRESHTVKSKVQAQEVVDGQISLSSVFPVEVDLTSTMQMIESRLSSIESSISAHGDRLERIESELQTTNGKLESVASDYVSEERFAQVQSSVTSLESSLGDLSGKVQGSSFCLTGFVGCQDNCGGWDESGNDSTKTPYSEDVYFSTPFASTPTVTFGLKDIEQYAPNDDDWYGWTLDATDVTTSGFTAYFVIDDRKITTLKGSWIACAPIA